jgi:hypothetical protein
LVIVGILVIVSAFGFIARCIYKKRQHICTRRPDRNESNVSINLAFIKIKVSNVLA